MGTDTLVYMSGLPARNTQTSSSHSIVNLVAASQWPRPRVWHISSRYPEGQEVSPERDVRQQNDFDAQATQVAGLMTRRFGQAGHRHVPEGMEPGGSDPQSDYRRSRPSIFGET